MAELPARITMPSQARKGEIIEIRVLARHPMERGSNARGLTPVPRQIINTFRARYGGEEIFRVDIAQGVSANPYIAFTTVATESGVLTFEWIEDGGAVFTRTAALKVT
jgi:sulfur-oxidizing protein SoxZ